MFVHVKRQQFAERNLERKKQKNSRPNRGLWVGSLSRLRVLVVILLVQVHVLVHCRILVLLVFRDQVVHVGLGFSELHLIHALTRVPMEESLATEHGGELLRDALEELLDGGGVADEGGGHLQAAGWNVADGCLDVVGDPLHEVAAVLVLHVHHLLVYLGIEIERSVHFSPPQMKTEALLLEKLV